MKKTVKQMLVYYGYEGGEGSIGITLACKREYTLDDTKETIKIIEDKNLEQGNIVRNVIIKNIMAFPIKL